MYSLHMYNTEMLDFRHPKDKMSRVKLLPQRERETWPWLQSTEEEAVQEDGLRSSESRAHLHRTGAEKSSLYLFFTVHTKHHFSHVL